MNPDPRRSRTTIPKRRIALATVVVILVAVAAFSTWALTKPPSTPQAPTPISMREFRDQNPYPSAPGITYQIEDVVTDRRVIATPGLSWDDSGAFGVMPSERMLFTPVTFRSLEGFAYHFRGNRTDEFPVGQTVRFVVVSRAWDIEGREIVTFEHHYVLSLLWHYSRAIDRGDYRPFEASTAVVDGTLYVNITSTTDLHPLPANWKDISVWFGRAGNDFVPAPGSARLYVAGDLAGTLYGEGGLFLRNGALDLPLGPGQSLQVSFDGTYDLIQLAASTTLGTVFLP